MEAYFHKDPRIEEWVDQITEKIFTVCLLTGVDSDTEFKRGCQIVTKVTSLLMGISDLPKEYLEDALKQLVEQQLPDERVINNFPAFQETMARMLHEGMIKVIDTQNSDGLKPSSIITEETIDDIIYQPCKNTERPEDVITNEETERVIAALASAYSDILKINDLSPLGLKGFDKENGLELETTKQNRGKTDHLKYVLSYIYPNTNIKWDFKFMDQSILAQVEDILICLNDSQHLCQLKSQDLSGWKLLMISTEDLQFPRRLEREIKKIRRKGIEIPTV